MDANGALAVHEAKEDWIRARRKVLYQQVVCFLKQCRVDLLPFEKVRARLRLSHRIDKGLQEIPLDRIRGSVGRNDDFTSAFLPRREHMEERWERVDVAMKAGKTPPVDVYQVGEAYFVLDGNHRVSIARQQGFTSIEAHVWEFPTSHGLGPEADLDELLLISEKIEFLEAVGASSSSELSEIRFSCPSCYDQLLTMIDTYRQGLADEAARPITTEKAALAWHKDVYLPAIEKIRQSDLLSRFPKRTEADLFIWAWEHSHVLERLVENEDAL